MRKSSQKTPEYIIRPTKLNESAQLNIAYNSFTGRSRTLEQFYWQWMDTPFEKSESWSIEHRPSSSIVGHHGVMTLPFVQNGQPISVGKTENTFVLPEHANQIFYPGLEKEALNQIRHKYKYIFTTASETSKGAIARFRKRLGYVVYGPIVCYLLNANFKALRDLCAQRFSVYGNFSVLGALILKAAFIVTNQFSRFRAGKTDVVPIPWNELDELSYFWNEHRTYYGITPDRSSVYYIWRFKENPHNEYQLFKLAQMGRTIGFAVISHKTIKSDGFVSQSIMIEDLIVTKGEKRFFFDAFTALIKHFDTAEMILFITIQQQDQVNSAIQRLLGLLTGGAFKTGPDLLVWGYSGNLPTWYFTNILSEGTNYDVVYSL